MGGCLGIGFTWKLVLCNLLWTIPISQPSTRHVCRFLTLHDLSCWTWVPHRLYTLLRAWLSFISHSQSVQSTQLALYSIGNFMKTGYIGVKFYCGLYDKIKTKPIQGKPVMEKCFLRWQSSQTKGLSENREKPLLTDTVCQKEWNPGRILKMRGKCGYFHYTEILCDFIITKVV